MKKLKLFKKFLLLTLAIIMCCGASADVLAAGNEEQLPDGWQRLQIAEDELENSNEYIQPREPAPGLSSISINKLYYNEDNKVLIEVVIMGTESSALCWCNGMQSTPDWNRTSSITNGNRVVGSRRYFKTNVSRAEVEAGIVLNIRAQATNALSPWNTQTTSVTVSLPR